MSKNTYYFPHDYNAHNDPKIVKLSMKGWDLVGLYWSIVGMLHEQDGWMPNDCDTIAFALRADKERITILMREPDLFIINGNLFTTQRVLNNLKILHEKSEKATISAMKRWNNAKAMRTHSEGNASKVKKSKEKKENTFTEKVSECFEYFKKSTGRPKINLDNARVKIIQSCLDKGRSVEEIKSAIDNFSKDEWPDRHKYCDLIYCIGTMNGKDNFDRWFNAGKNISGQDSVRKGF